MDGHIRLANNALLTTIGSSFSSILAVGGLQWYENGGQTGSGASTAGSRSFCASARGVLCSSTTNYNRNGADDAYNCSSAYCLTSTDC